MVQPDANPYAWLEQDAPTVAPLLIGWELVSHSGRQTTAGKIVEVEAYLGTSDPASHAYHGFTKRTAPMFETAGAVYVYKSYGVHNCINLVTGREGDAQAVLIRALEPSIGIDIMSNRRQKTDVRNLCSGPGKLTVALGIDLSLSGIRLDGTLSLIPPRAPIAQEHILAGRRIGVSKAADYPWRFYLENNTFVSHR